MQKLTLATTATVIAIAIAIAIAPSLTTTAYAKKTVIDTPPDCFGDPQDREECPGESGGQNPNRDQIEAECSVTGGGDQPVRGQEKKICGED